MELWIRTQKKEDLIKVYDIFINKENDKFISANCKRVSGYGFSYKSLGEYKTKKRALEVLDEIQKRIEVINNAYDDTYVHCVYEMPES